MQASGGYLARSACVHVHVNSQPHRLTMMLQKPENVTVHLWEEVSASGILQELLQTKPPKPGRHRWPSAACGRS